MDQSNISHIVTRYYWENNYLKGYVEAANTARGKDFDGLIRQGCKVGFSLRAVGPITEEKNGYTLIKDPITIFCYDWIIHPSHASAYMDSVVSESKKLGNSINESANLFKPFYMEEAVDYVKNESANLKLVTNFLDIEIKNNISLSEDHRKVIIKEGDNKIVIFTEDYIAREINGYLSKI
jgi:hypothetical protein